MSARKKAARVRLTDLQRAALQKLYVNHIDSLRAFPASTRLSLEVRGLVNQAGRRSVFRDTRYVLTSEGRAAVVG